MGGSLAKCPSYPPQTFDLDWRMVSKPDAVILRELVRDLALVGVSDPYRPGKRIGQRAQVQAEAERWGSSLSETNGPAPYHRDMPTVQALFHFDVEDLVVRPEVLGTQIELERDGHPVVIRVPSQDDDFSYFKDEHIMLIGGSTTEADGLIRHNVSVLRVGVEFEVPWPGGPGGSEKISLAEMEETSEKIQAAAEIAKDILAEYLQIVRITHDQYWLGRSGYRPEVRHYTQIRDIDTGELLNTSLQQRLLVIGRRAPGLDADDHASIASTLQRGDPLDLPLPRTLLGDALYLINQANPAQPREAVLLAAMACEVAIRQSLLEAAAPDAQAVLEWSLKNPRDVSVQAASLYDKGAEATTSRSLRKEYPALYKKLGNLFTARNRVAHQGEATDHGEAYGHVETAVASVAWARGLISTDVRA